MKITVFKVCVSFSLCTHTFYLFIYTYYISINRYVYPRVLKFKRRSMKEVTEVWLIQVCPPVPPDRPLSPGEEETLGCLGGL